MSLSKALFAGLFGLAVSVRMATAEPAVAETKLNLRAGPGPAFGVIAVMPPGAKVDVQKCHGTWCRVTHGRHRGYTSRAYLRLGADAYASAAAEAAPPAPPREAAPVITGPRIWRWRDPDWRNRHWRKFGWRHRHRR